MNEGSWYERPADVPEQLAAGGVVVRHDGGRVLVAFAREQEFPELVLPKGHVDPGETIEVAARREIEEEVGVSDLRLVESLGVRERLSFSRDEWKITHYFLYETSQVDATPTETDRHTEMFWYPLDELPVMFWQEQRDLLERNRSRIEMLLNVRQSDRSQPT